MRHVSNPVRALGAGLLGLALGASVVACDRSSADLFPDDPAVVPVGPRAASPADPAARSHDTPALQLADPGSPSGTAEAVPMPPPIASRAARDRITLDVPEHWEEERPSSTMRVAQWRLLADEDMDAGECVLFHFPGGGDAESNLMRWVGQFEQPDGERSEGRAMRATREAGGIPVSLVRVGGTYLDQNPPMTGPIVRREGWALLGAVLEPPGDPWFLKCTGPQPVIEAHEGAVVHLLDSFRLADAP